MSTFYLFRHAESVMNAEATHIIGGRSNHTPLTPEGRIQASKLGVWIARQKIMPDVVYVSPAVRTLETMAIALEAAGIICNPIVEDRIQELTHGEFEGAIRSEIFTPQLLEQVQRELKDFKLGTGESMNDVARRKREWTDDVRAKSHETIFAFTHGYAIRCLVGDYLKWDHPTIRAAEVGNASATILQLDSSGLLLDYQYSVDTQTA